MFTLSKQRNWKKLDDINDFVEIQFMPITSSFTGRQIYIQTDICSHRVFVWSISCARNITYWNLWHHFILLVFANLFLSTAKMHNTRKFLNETDTTIKRRCASGVLNLQNCSSTPQVIRLKGFDVLAKYRSLFSP